MLKIKSKKAALEVIQTDTGRSVRVLYHLDNLSSCGLSWHYHPEIELVYLPRGKGKLFVGNVVKKYEQGVLILLHSNISHLSFNQGFEDEIYEEYVIQIAPEQLENMVRWFPELGRIGQLLAAAQKGVMLPLQAEHDFLNPHFENLQDKTPAEQLLSFFNILNVLSYQNYEGIGATLNVQVTPLSIERIETVFKYISTDFAKNITSQDAANLLHFTDSSFCRFFQKHTQKTFKQVLTEYRIAHACKQLAHTDKSIETIAYESGFGSHSFFNKMFKRTNGITPFDYRSEWREMRQD